MRTITMKSNRRIAVFALFLMMSVSLFAQNSSNGGGTETGQAPLSEPGQRAPEEITVTGQKSLSTLRKELRQAENAVNSLFNDFNGNDAFDIVCRSMVYTGSHISERVCEPRFYTDLKYQNTQDFNLGIDEQLGPNELQAMYCNRFLEFQNALREAALANPELLSAIRNHSELKAAYEEQRKK